MKKEKKIVVDKEYLKGFKSILIVLENCDVYEICMKDILDVYCEAALISKQEDKYRAEDGFIKIAACAKDSVELLVKKNKQLGTEWDYRLRKRLEMCNGGADMTSFSLKDKECHEIHVYVPYDPLEDIIHGNDIELSNCPSLKIDGEGNMIIAFGKSSKQPKRKDNNYEELVTGWKDAFGDYSPRVLKVKGKSLSTFGGEKMNFSLYFEICDKNCKKDIAELVFMDCKNVRMEMLFPEKGDCEIVMSKMADGRIYVGFDGLGMDFICSSVIEYDYYCNRKKNNNGN